jgi:catechol 2,3-dioxygenase-like lactoylglutathione lyase family enzyme
VLHHAALEVSAETVAEERAFWALLGFAEVPVPETLGDEYTWFERQGTQVHLIQTPDPAVPPEGHLAVVAPDFEDTVTRLGQAGFEVCPGRELWGERRAKVTSPGGHIVELMAAPPPTTTA